MIVNSHFCGGNIKVNEYASDGSVHLEINRDRKSDFFQWFYFEVTASIGEELQFHILNAKNASYPSGWTNYKARASTDGENWFLIDTVYQNGELRLTHVATHSKTQFAYFAPFSLARHERLIAWSKDNGAEHKVVCQSVEGEPIDKLTVGEGSLPIWVIARQHPGETMAEWWMSGFLKRLLDQNDTKAQSLRKKATLHIVPNMNPDGSRLGNLRTNAAGANLNREWNNPSRERSPEVHGVRNEMFQTNVSMCLDVHGDEGLPYNFLDGPLGIPSMTDSLAKRYLAFVDEYLKASDEMQKEHGYKTDPPGTADLSICTNWIAETFQCLSATLEQPFKDNANAPDSTTGWSPKRCEALGAAGVDALLSSIDSGIITKAVALR